MLNNYLNGLSDEEFMSFAFISAILIASVAIAIIAAIAHILKKNGILEKLFDLSLEVLDAVYIVYYNLHYNLKPEKKQQKTGKAMHKASCQSKVKVMSEKQIYGAKRAA